MKAEDLAARAQVLIEKGAAVLLTHSRPPPNVIGFPTLDSGAFSEWQTQTLTFLISAVGKDHVYVVNFEKNVKDGYFGEVQAGIGILRALP